jgi:hypothetical protein
MVKRLGAVLSVPLLALILAAGTPDCALGAAGCSGWCEDTCDVSENWNDQFCERDWCVNAGFAYYICEDGIPTSKQCPHNDCPTN